ncbi:MAG: PorT family protein [Brumimicrobium sp.]|nr:PorT family protein [Brumimicrobium sp.]MCO5268090.1 PorT family protein [Brumimicrobium sp.]
MKSKLLLAIFISIIGFSTSHAQLDKKKEGLRIGIEGNIHQSNIRGIHSFSKGRFSPAIGFFVKIPFQRSLGEGMTRDASFYFSPMIEYCMSGENDKSSRGTVNYNNDYVQIPLLFDYVFELGRVGYRNMCISFGPVISYAVNNKIYGNINEVYKGKSATLDVLEQAHSSFNKLDVGATVSIGYRLNPLIELFVRYDNGFMKVYKDYDKHYTFNYRLGIGTKFLIK